MFINPPVKKFDNISENIIHRIAVGLSEEEIELIIILSVFGAAILLLMLLLVVLWVQLASVKKQLRQTPSVRVQKLKMDDENHAFQNPTISPDEELSRRGYSMYVPSDGDVESGRGTERYVTPPTAGQTGGQFVEELAREIDSRQQRQSTAPPFLLQSIQENKRKSRLSNPVAQQHQNQTQSRQSETNPNFIY
ncbi:uncharacterized protein isoform X1 [Choristoneura fumiferana]|uniref:uncharacterized protein isoform X1 n=1 Tax=Choristoneura fumiferana TaxID=7141 RepID=UPI003D1542FA